MIRRFGRGVARDARDYELVPEATDRKIRYWDDTRWYGDQGDTPECVGYAWAHWLYSVPIRNWIDPSGIYYFAKYIDEWPGQNYDGTSVRAGAKVLHRLGVIEEYSFAWDMESLAYALLELGPVTIGINWYEGMQEPDSRANIYRTGQLLGGHAVVLTGINLAGGVVRGKNSWGRSWGRNGRFFLRLDDLEQLLKEDGEVCIATEKVLEPQD